MRDVRSLAKRVAALTGPDDGDDGEVPGSAIEPTGERRAEWLALWEKMQAEIEADA